MGMSSTEQGPNETDRSPLESETDEQLKARLRNPDTSIDELKEIAEVSFERRGTPFLPTAEQTDLSSLSNDQLSALLTSGVATPEQLEQIAQIALARAENSDLPPTGK